MATPISTSPQLPEGFYAINNQFLVSGPKGIEEFRMLDVNEDMYVRLDLPGVPEHHVSVSLCPSRKGVMVKAVAPMGNKYDSSHREYITITGGLVCRCCEISPSFTSEMRDGVLRLVLSKTNIGPGPHRSSPFSHLAGPSFRDDLRSTGPHRFPYGTNPNDPTLTGPVLKPHPHVLIGSEKAYESRQLKGGRLYLRIDMPGVPNDKFTVSVRRGRVSVTGEAPANLHDSAGRFYSGDVAMLARPVDQTEHRIQTIIRDGVIRLLIPPF